MTLRILIIAVVAMFTSGLFSADAAAPSLMEAASAKAFVLNYRLTPDQHQDVDLARVARPKGATLTPDQVRRFERALVGKVHVFDPNGPTPACAPLYQHAVVFYDRAGKIISTVYLCLTCGDIYAVGPAEMYLRRGYEPDLQTIRALVRELGLPQNPLSDEHARARQ